MGFSDNFPDAGAKIVSAFGQSATYTPADTGIEPFTVTAVFDEVAVDELDPNIIRDLSACMILNSELQAEGVTAPGVRYERHSGDTISRIGPDGTTSETWEIVSSRYDDSGIWDLIIERNIRIVPRG